MVEVVVSTALVAVMILFLYSGIGSCFTYLILSRQNARASQIMLEKMETIRLYSWDQISSNGFMPATFRTPFYPPTPSALLAGTNATDSVWYYGSVEITNAPVNSNYVSHMKQITISLVWTNRGIPRTREIQTFVSEYGVQNYVYN